MMDKEASVAQASEQANGHQKQQDGGGMDVDEEL